MPSIFKDLEGGNEGDAASDASSASSSSSWISEMPVKRRERRQN